MPQNKKTLVLGATPKPERYAYIATEMLVNFGHTVVPFRGGVGEKVWAESKRTIVVWPLLFPITT